MIGFTIETTQDHLSGDQKRKKNMPKKTKVSELLPKLKIKCKTCKKNMDFHLHYCEKGGISEYCGCEKCDNYCEKCTPYRWD